MRTWKCRVCGYIYAENSGGVGIRVTRPGELADAVRNAIKNQPTGNYRR